MGNLMADILKSSGLLWESAMKQGPPASAASSGKEDGKKNRYLDSLENTVNHWQAISSTLNDPNIADAILKGINTLPEFYMTMAKTGWEASVRLQKQVMEKASTLDEAVAIMRKGPRTCEYYFVISDAKSKQAVGISATSTSFEVIHPGESHPRLPHPIEDTVLMSAGSRYEALAERVQAGYGKFDAHSARDLMTRPVCMNSNIHSALFAPDTLEFWVANADSANVASHTRYTHYNLADLLRPAGQ